MMTTMCKGVKRSNMPTMDVYKSMINRLVESDEITTLIAVRMGCEMGMSRLEIVNAKVSHLDLKNKRGLWVEVAKKVRRGTRKTMVRGKIRKEPIMKMRQREIPVNTSLYQLLKTYCKNSEVYILQRDRGDDENPFTERYINTLYEKNNVPWPPHRSRHFFKASVWSWMMQHRQPDSGLLKELMGHDKTTHEGYGEYSWDYKRDVIDKVFQ